MADKRDSAVAEKAESGKSLKMVNIPTKEMSDKLTEAATAQGVSVNRYITNLIAKEFGLTVPEPKRRTAPLRQVFEAQYPRNEGEADADYEKRFADFKAQQIREANAKRAERTRSAMELMETLKKAAANDTVGELDIKALLAQLQA